MKPKKKRSLADLFERARAARAAMGEAKWAAYQLEQRAIAAESLVRMKREFDDFMKSPESAARDALEHGLNELKNNATIKQSDTCIEALDAFLYCVTYNWGVRDSEALLWPIGAALGRPQRKKASKAPRPNSKSPLKAAITKAMRRHKPSCESFKTFMQMWCMGSIDGLSAKTLDHKDSYVISDENGDLGEQVYAWGTLQQMYSDKKKK